VDSWDKTELMKAKCLKCCGGNIIEVMSNLASESDDRTDLVLST
jgi:hypothetical protein